MENPTGPQRARAHLTPRDSIETETVPRLEEVEPELLLASVLDHLYLRVILTIPQATIVHLGDDLVLRYHTEQGNVHRPEIYLIGDQETG